MESMTPNQAALAVNEAFYNPNGLTVYKHIDSNGDVTYPSIKTVHLEGKLVDLERLQAKVNALQSQINKIIDNLTEEYWYDGNTDTSTVLADLCEIIGHEPKKTIEFTATMRFTGTIDVNLAEADEFDLTDILSDAYVDINHGDVVINDYELYDANEC